MTPYTDIIAKLEGASGPDRELDGLVAMAAGGAYNVIAGWRYNAEGLGREVEPFTASLDAALALVEERLPGWEGEIDFGRLPHACLHPPQPYPMDDEHNAYGATPPIAVLIALFIALDSKTSSEASTKEQSQ